MTIEERIEFIEGQNTVLKHALALLIIMHPHKKEISDVVKKIFSYPEVISSSESYKNGINSILQEVDDLSNTALLAGVARDQGSSKNH